VPCLKCGFISYIFWKEIIHLISYLYCVPECAIYNLLIHYTWNIRGSFKKILEFFNINGLVHHEFMLLGKSVTGYFCMQVLQRLCCAVQRKQCDKGQDQWFLHHDNDWATHRLLCGNSLPRKTFLSSAKHCTLQAGRCARFLLCRWLGKCCCMSYHYSAVP
jgi:hypothetical protein